MLIGKPKIFSQFPEIIFGFSKRTNVAGKDKFKFNMSYSVGDFEEIVDYNRSVYLNELCLSNRNVVIQKQIHSDIVNIVDRFNENLIGDAMITSTPKLGLAILAADCTNIYLFDPFEEVIAAVHSGWAGTEKKILVKTLGVLYEEYNSKPKNIFAYLAPSISVKNYEVGKEFLKKFDRKYLIGYRGRFKLDLKKINYDMLIEEGVPLNQVEVSEICSYEDERIHSYRRDKSLSGRGLGVIALR